MEISERTARLVKAREERLPFTDPVAELVAREIAFKLSAIKSTNEAIDAREVEQEQARAKIKQYTEDIRRLLPHADLLPDESIPVAIEAEAAPVAAEESDKVKADKVK